MNIAVCPASSCFRISVTETTLKSAESLIFVAMFKTNYRSLPVMDIFVPGWQHLKISTRGKLYADQILSAT